MFGVRLSIHISVRFSNHVPLLFQCDAATLTMSWITTYLARHSSSSRSRCSLNRVEMIWRCSSKPQWRTQKYSEYVGSPFLELLFYIHDPNLKGFVSPCSSVICFFFKCILSKHFEGVANSSVTHETEETPEHLATQNARKVCQQNSTFEFWRVEGGPLVGVFVYILKKAPQIGLQSAAQKSSSASFLRCSKAAWTSSQGRRLADNEFSGPKLQATKSVYGEEDTSNDYGDLKKAG